MALLLHLPFNGDANDDSGNGYNATLVASPTYANWRPSRQALSLNGSTQYADVSSHVANLDGLTTGTLAFWFRTTAAAHAAQNDQGAFCLSDNNGNTVVRVVVGESSSTYSDEALNFIVLDAGTIILRMHIQDTASTRLKDGVWHHVAIIIDGVANKIIIDGISRTITYTVGSSTTAAFTNVTAADQCFIGAAQWNSSALTNQFGGEIADFRLYDSPLTEAQVIDDVFAPYCDIAWSSSLALNGSYGAATVKSDVAVVAPDGTTPTDADFDAYRYRHHTRLWWKDGVTYLAHSAAPTSEKQTGYYAVLWHSSNKGSTWTRTTLIDRQDDFTDVDTTGDCYQLYPGGFVEHAGTVYAIVSLELVDTSVTPETRVLLAVLARAVGSSGATGSAFRITSASYTPASGYSEVSYDSTLGPPLWALAEPRLHWGGDSDGTGLAEGWRVSTSGSDYSMTEPTVIRLPDNTWARLWRHVPVGYTIETEAQQNYTELSNDSGATWYGLQSTRIPDHPSASAGFRNSEGRIVVVGNNQQVTESGDRRPLYLAYTAVDDTVLTTAVDVKDSGGSVLYPGTYKGPGWQYPDIIQVGNYYYISCSKGKEAIQFIRMLVPGLTDNDNDVSGAAVYGHLWPMSVPVYAHHYRTLARA